MAIEFGSRKETFENFKVYETMLAGRPFKVEMGKMCGLSNASALIRYGETCVMCNVVMSPKPREGVDFFPLNVENEEKLYAAGRIPGSHTQPRDVGISQCSEPPFETGQQRPGKPLRITVIQQQF